MTLTKKSEVIGENFVQVSLHPSQISHGLTEPSAITGRWLTPWQMARRTFLIIYLKKLSVARAIPFEKPIPVSARSNAWVCGWFFLGLWVWIPPVLWVFVCCESYVLSDLLITCPGEPYRLWYTSLWSWSLDNKETLAHYGLSSQEKETYTSKYQRTSEEGIDRNVECNVETYFVANVSICFSRLRQVKASKASG